MPSLRLEDHIFRIVENQYKLSDYLGSQAATWDWAADMSRGTLSFLAQADQKVLADLPVRLIGTESEGTSTWLWAWANQSVPKDTALTGGSTKIREEGQKEGLAVFNEPDPVPLVHEKYGTELAVICAGYLEHFTFYAGGYSGGVAFFAIPSFPEAEALPADALRKITVMMTAIQALAFNHRAATVAYLGEPSRTDGSASVFPVGGAELHITFDEQNRIADIQSTVGPGATRS